MNLGLEFVRSLPQASHVASSDLALRPPPPLRRFIFPAHKLVRPIP